MVYGVWFGYVGHAVYVGYEQIRIYANVNQLRCFVIRHCFSVHGVYDDNDNDGNDDSDTIIIPLIL